jgi:transcriptional regulator with XRE-family HTH domain
MWQDVPEGRAANMEIGKKLKDARMKSGFTQETVAEKINVSRQTISNWENEKSYPDIISVIALSDLYSISLDDLLKGDREMMEHLEECTNVVKSTQKLIGAIILNAVTVILLIALSMLLPDKSYYLLVVFCLAIMSSSVLLYQIIKRI